jgi:hypothetical protein
VYYPREGYEDRMGGRSLKYLLMVSIGRNSALSERFCRKKVTSMMWFIPNRCALSDIMELEASECERNRILRLSGSGYLDLWWDRGQRNGDFRNFLSEGPVQYTLYTVSGALWKENLSQPVVPNYWFTLSIVDFSETV